MKILFVGDIVGRGGRRVLREKLPELRERFQADLVIANVENAAGGFGITPKIARQILNLGVDVMTSGNHIWDRKEILEFLSLEPRLLRPLNYPPGAPGQGSYLGETAAGVRVAVVNLQGRVFMPTIDCPFQTAQREIERLRRETPLIIVDFHAEATSEKMAFGWFIDGKVSAVIGTHTHVPTADERILPKGTAYISDVGMTGSYESVIGMSVRPSLSRFLTGVPERFEPSVKNPRLAGALIEVNASDGRACSIIRIME